MLREAGGYFRRPAWLNLELITEFQWKRQYKGKVHEDRVQIRTQKHCAETQWI